MKNKKRMSDMKPGQKGKVLELGIKGKMLRRILDIGLTENTTIKCVGKSPFGDPLAYDIRGAIIAIRKEHGKNIIVETGGFREE